MKRIFGTNHLLMQFLARTNTNDFLLGSGRNGSCQIWHGHRGNFFDINFAAHHVVKCMPNQLHALLKRNHKTGHTRVGDGQHATVFN